MKGQKHPARIREEASRAFFVCITSSERVFLQLPVARAWLLKEAHP